MSHTLRMLIGCLLPILAVFLLPLFGISEGAGIWVFLILMFACHLMMMRGGHHGHGRNEKNQ